MKTNRDNALSTLALNIEECVGIETRITYFKLGDEVDRLIQTLDKIPLILIGRGDKVRLDRENGHIANELIESFALPNDGGNGLVLSGTYTNTIAEIQIVVITRSQFENMEITTKILKHLNKRPRLHYDVVLNDKYVIKKGAYIHLMDTEEKEFSSSTNQEIALVITACEYEMKEQNFNLSKESFEELKVCH